MQISLTAEKKRRNDSNDAHDIVHPTSDLLKHNRSKPENGKVSASSYHQDVKTTGIIQYLYSKLI